MNGLRYYIGSLLLLTATVAHSADIEKTKKFHLLKISVAIPTSNRLLKAQRDFFIALQSDSSSIYKIESDLKQKIESVAKEEPSRDCSCDICKDILAAQALAGHKNKSVQFAYAKRQASATMTIAQLKKEEGFDIEQDALYAKFECSSTPKGA